MIRAFTITIEARDQRTVRVAAKSEQAARAIAGILLRGNDRVVHISDDVAKQEVDRSPDMVIEALERLRFMPFFDWYGQSQVVEDWLLRAQDKRLQGQANVVLAMAGLRVQADGRVAIGSPSSIPTLHGWFRNTPFAGASLHAVLVSVPGAQRTALTLAGCRTRGVILPFNAVVPDVADAPREGVPA